MIAVGRGRQLLRRRIRHSLTYLVNARLSHRTANPGTAASTREDTAVSPSSTWSIRARSLLRGILRECTYLPDPQARQHIAKYAVTRFKRYSFKAWERRNDPTLEDRLKDKHEDAQKALKTLQKANHGDRKALLRVLLVAYGRVGKRRHDLMLPLIPEQAEDDAPPAVLSPALHALLQSQMRASPPKLTRPNPKRLTPDIPELNSYLRPMPRSRVKNMTKDWYKDMLRRTLPPLPVAEWYRLRDLAAGYEALDVPPRRSAVGSSAATPSALEMIMIRSKGKLHRNVFEEQRHRELSPRFMQRLWAQVFFQCPRMEWNAADDRWNVTWGQHALRSKKAQV